MINPILKTQGMFSRKDLPLLTKHYKTQNITLSGDNNRSDTSCPLHHDAKPSNTIKFKTAEVTK